MAITLEEIKSVKGKVEAVLNDETTAMANCSDDLLYTIICKQIAAQKGIDIETMSFCEVMKHRHEWELPNFETVRRSRQKVHHDNPELRMNEVDRAESEKNFRAFAREKDDCCKHN